jgi:LPXTG-motif cell wall-anchored protein
MTGSGGGGFVIDTATLFLFMLGLAALGGIWIWLLSRKRR